MTSMFGSADHAAPPSFFLSTMAAISHGCIEEKPSISPMITVTDSTAVIEITRLKEELETLKHAVSVMR